MGTLSDAVKDSGKRPAIISDCETLINAEVASKRGLTGMAVRTGFKAIKKFKPDIVPKAMDDLLDDFSEKIDPFWGECQQKGEPPRQYFEKNKQKVADALLTVTDERAASSKHRTLVSAYRSLRGKAVQHIGEAMPRFADLLIKHAS